MSFKGLYATGLTKSFGERKVVEDVHLHLRRGEAVGLLGPNGAGKTTCFYMITGLIKPGAGTISMDDVDITHLPMYKRARLGIGYLAQEPSIFRGMTVENNIRSVLELFESSKSAREERLTQLLQEFGIEHVRKSSALSLSGGERRRVEIARALASNPCFMLLDEPLAGIDPIAVQDIRALIAKLKERHIGVLITDHNVRDTLRIVDRAYILNDGVILKEGTPADIIQDKQVQEIYLGDSFSI